MYLVIGLGNPDKQYQRTWHNAGFMVADALAKTLGNTTFSEVKKLHSLVAETIYEDEKIIIAKPQTYMNNSGRATKALIDYYHVPLEQVLVTHDEVDLAFGTIRLSIGAGPAGHRGVGSIIETIKSQDFIRVRVGIGRPVNQTPIPDYVLQKIPFTRRIGFGKVVDKTVEAIKAVLTDGLDAARNRYN